MLGELDVVELAGSERADDLVKPREDLREPTHTRSIIASRSALGRAALPAKSVGLELVEARS